jgi:hypothetical protein
MAIVLGLNMDDPALLSMTVEILATRMMEAVGQRLR